MTAYTLSYMIPVVIDTNVFVAGLRSEGGASREVLRHFCTCYEGFDLLRHQILRFIDDQEFIDEGTAAHEIE